MFSEFCRWLSPTLEDDEEAEKEDCAVACELGKEDDLMEAELQSSLVLANPSATRMTKIANLLMKNEISTEAMMEMIPPYPYNSSPDLHSQQPSIWLSKSSKMKKVEASGRH